MGVLKVVGVGKKNYPVNLITVTIEINIKDKEYQSIVTKEKEAFESLKKAFKKDLKTVVYRIDQHIQYNEENKIVWYGYKVFHQLKLSFKMDLTRLGDVLEIIKQAPHNPEFRIRYESKGYNVDELRKLAIEDAIHQAKIYSEAAGIELKSISKISTVSEEQPVVLRQASYKMDMSFDDLEQKHEIYMEWEI